ncbi:hypothetical protein D3C72_645800 [compost metagenome]
MPAKKPTRWMAPAPPVFAGAPAPTKSSQARDCCHINNNPLRQFVFFSYNFPYILPAAS